MTAALLLAFGTLESYFGYRQSLTHIEATQALQARRAAVELTAYLENLRTVLQDVSRVGWGSVGFSREHRREEFYRLLRIVPAIVDVTAVDDSGIERLRVSRTAIDDIDLPRQIEEPRLLSSRSQTGILFGETFFRHGELPSIRVSTRDGQGVIVATLDLRSLGEMVSRLATAEGGTAFVVDKRGLLIAHPTPTQVLAHLDLSRAEAVKAMLASAQGSGAAGQVRALFTQDIRGRPVITTGTRIAGPDWAVFIEHQRAEALRPAIATLSLTLMFMSLAVVAGLFAGIVFARQMAAPIVALRRATARIAAGDLETKLVVKRHDEIEDLAGDFNQMVLRLRDLYESLEAKVANRTAELSRARDVLADRAREIEELNQRLMAQLDELSLRKDEAERANAAKSRFLAAASHDLRQPMHSISLLVGVLRGRLSDPPQLALADKVQTAVSTMENLFGNLLDISKLDAGAVHAHIEDVDLGWLLERAGQTWLPQAQEKGLSLRIRPGRWVVKGDATLLERVVGNLLANAIRYTRRGGVLVGCRRHGNQCELQIWDTGLGIAAEHQEAIFEEFFRIGAPGVGQEKGLGLGLSIVRRCVHLMGYTLKVESRPGRGSVFKVLIPLSAGDGAIRSPGTNQPAQVHALEGNFIVVVEDDATSSEAIRDALLAAGCHVVTAPSAAGALSQLESHLRSPDLILTDYQLGSAQDGLSVIRKLRSHYDENIAALIVTANTDARLLTEATELGASVLHKPVGLQRLMTALKESLDHAGC